MIEFSEVTYTHPNGVVAIRDVNLKITEGEVVAIVGANGAGKTTLVKHINGLLKPTRGKVTVFGQDTKDASVAQLSRKVGIVFQNPDHQLFSDTVENEIAFGLRNFGFPEGVVSKRVSWALEFFSLQEYRGSSPLVLSGGEKKRLCLATVLAWDPDVIILDEPTVGQDMIQKERLEQIVRMLIERRKTVIIVSHDIEFIWPIQPRIIVMAGGKVVADGHASEIFSDDRILSAANLIRPQLVDLSMRLKVRPERPFVNVFEAKRWLLPYLGR